MACGVGEETRYAFYLLLKEVTGVYADAAYMCANGGILLPEQTQCREAFHVHVRISDADNARDKLGVPALTTARLAMADCAKRSKATAARRFTLRMPSFQVAAGRGADAQVVRSGDESAQEEVEKEEEEAQKRASF